jgi:hypothetical protein
VKIPLLVVILLLISSGFILAQEVSSNSVASILFGTNYYSATGALSLKMPITKRLYGGITLGTGSMAVNFKPNQKKFGILYSTTSSADVTFDIAHIADIGLYYFPSRNGLFQFFNQYGFGFFHSTIKMHAAETWLYPDRGYGEYYEGDKRINLFGLHCLLGILEFKSQETSKISISLSGRLDVTRLKLPIFFAVHDAFNVYDRSFDGNGYYYIPYGDLLLGINYRF